MEYSKDIFLDFQIKEMISALGMVHISPERVKCIRSRGTKSKRTLARIHTISKAVQNGLGIKPHYVIEIVSENFDPLSPEEKTKTLLHELMHIPRSFGGGFRHHRPHVNKRAVSKMYKKYLNAKK